MHALFTYDRNIDILTSYTGDKTVAARSRTTHALGLMPASRAHRTLRARRRFADRTAGLAQEVAGLVVATVVVHLAFHADARHQRVALQAHWAHAARRMEIHAAFRAAAARG